MQGLWRLWGFFCWKVTKSRFLLSIFSFHILVGLTSLDEHLSTQTWERIYLDPTRLSIINVSLLTLCGKGIEQSQYPRETDDSESNFQPFMGKPNTHAWTYPWWTCRISNPTGAVGGSIENASIHHRLAHTISHTIHKTQDVGYYASERLEPV